MMVYRKYFKLRLVCGTIYIMNFIFSSYFDLCNIVLRNVVQKQVFYRHVQGFLKFMLIWGFLHYT